jgi:ABC-type sulfate transport system substrate-binding protein
MDFTSRSRRPMVLGVGATLAVATMVISGCSSSGKSAASSSTAAASSAASSASGPGPYAGQSVAIVAYSVPKPAYDALTKAFQATQTGKGVTFTASYGASGTQSTAVSSGQKADYVAFSVTPDLTKLVPSLVAPTWNSGSDQGPRVGLGGRHHRP